MVVGEDVDAVGPGYGVSISVGNDILCEMEMGGVKANKIGESEE